jgi:hypothetical protein
MIRRAGGNSRINLPYFNLFVQEPPSYFSAIILAASRTSTESRSITFDVNLSAVPATDNAAIVTPLASMTGAATATIPSIRSPRETAYPFCRTRSSSATGPATPLGSARFQERRRGQAEARQPRGGNVPVSSRQIHIFPEPITSAEPMAWKVGWRVPAPSIPASNPLLAERPEGEGLAPAIASDFFLFLQYWASKLTIIFCLTTSIIRTYDRNGYCGILFGVKASNGPTMIMASRRVKRKTQLQNEHGGSEHRQGPEWNKRKQRRSHQYATQFYQGVFG